MESSNKVFKDAIDSEFIKHPGITDDAYTYKKIVSNESSKPNKRKKNITLVDIERKHNKTKDSSEYIAFLKKQLNKGANVEKEHTNDIKIARQIAKDHLLEDPKYYIKLAKMETKEATGASSAGGYVAPLFPNLENVSEACWKGYRRVGGKMKNGKMVPNCVPIKEDKWTEINFKPIFNEGKVEAKEATTTASTGSYEVPGAWAKSMSKKDWGAKRKTQIPGGKFVQIKKKCLKFPYCNQGDTGAIKLTEQNKTTPQKSGMWNPFSLFNAMVKSITPNRVKRVSLIFPRKSWEFFVNKIFKALGIVTGVYNSLDEAIKFIQTLKSQNVKVDELIIGSHGTYGTLLMTKETAYDYRFDNSFLESMRGIIHSRSKVFFTACRGAEYLDGLKDAAEKLGAGVYGSAGIYNPVTNQSQKGFYYCSPKEIQQIGSPIRPIQFEKNGYLSLYIPKKYIDSIFLYKLPYRIRISNSVFGIDMPDMVGIATDSWIYDTSGSAFREGEELVVFDLNFKNLFINSISQNNIRLQDLYRKTNLKDVESLVNYCLSKIYTGGGIIEIKIKNKFVDVNSLDKGIQDKELTNEFLLKNNFCKKVSSSPISWLSSIFNY